MMALSAACRSLGIPCIELQHGQQGDWHSMYTHWTKCPPDGYDVIPSCFWMWGEEGMKRLNGWVAGPNRRAIVGGNPWLAYQVHQQSGGGEEVVRKRSVAGEGKVILISLQYTELPDFVWECINQRSKDHWLLRLHPRFKEDLAPFREACEARNTGTNWEIERPSSADFYEIVQEADLHLTGWSTTAFEAIHFGVPTIVMHPNGRDAMGATIRDGVFGYAESLEELNRWVEEPPKGRESVATIETSPAVIRSRFFDINRSSYVREGRPWASVKKVVVIEPVWAGHTPYFFAEFCLAFRDLGLEVKGMCASPEGAAEILNAEGGQDIELFPIRNMPLIRAIKINSIRRLVTSFRYFSQVGTWVRTAFPGVRKREVLLCFPRLDDERLRLASKWNWCCGHPWVTFWVSPFFLRKGARVPSRRLLSWMSPRGLIGVGLLDESFEERARRYTGAPTFRVPQVVSTGINEENQLCQTIRKLAKGRPIIFSGGHLKPTKGIVRMLRLAGAAQSLFFVVVGEVVWKDFSSSEKDFLQGILHEQENVFCWYQRVRSDEDFNALFNLSDVVYAAYEDFPYSSNLLSKAVAFRKRLLVTEGTIMERDVRDFRLGAAIAESASDEETLQTLLNLTQVAKDQSDVPEWAGYEREQSRDSLTRELRRVCGPVLSDQV
ncbi:MAG: hypothetical protein AAF191_13510 [Verrucomicrobiota bacterium]